MRLYSYPHSSLSWAVRMGLSIKGLAYETVHVDISRRSDARERMGYRAINTLRQVPVLEWEQRGTVRRTSQSLAILELIEELQPQPALLPTDTFLRARTRELACIVQSGTQPLQNNYVLGQIAALGADEQAWARHFIVRGLEALEQACVQTAGLFLVGDTPTLADLFLGPQLFNARRVGAALDAVPTLLAIEKNLLELNAYRTTHPDASAT